MVSRGLKVGCLLETNSNDHSYEILKDLSLRLGTVKRCLILHLFNIVLEVLANFFLLKEEMELSFNREHN